MLPRGAQIFVQVRCACLLLSEQGDQTARYLDADCEGITRIQVKIPVFNNVVYLAYRLNQTTDFVRKQLAADRLDLPDNLLLNLPTLTVHDGLGDIEAFDLSKTIAALNEGEIPSLHHLSDDVYGLIDASHGFDYKEAALWTLGGGACMASVAITVLFVKGNALKRFIGLVSMTKGAHATLISAAENDLITVIISRSFEILMYIHVTLVTIIMIEWIIHNAPRVLRNRFIRATAGRIQRQPKQTTSMVLLEIYNMNYGVTFTVQTIRATPGSVTVSGSLGHETLELLNYCLYSELRMEWNTVAITVAKPSQHEGWGDPLNCPLPKRVQVVGIDINMLKLLLSQPWDAAFLIGTDQRYTRFPIRKRPRVPEKLATTRMIDMDEYHSDFNDGSMEDVGLPPYPRTYL